MRRLSFPDEAKRCRLLAAEFEGGSQGAFLLRAAETFDDLGDRDIVQADRVAAPAAVPTGRKLPTADTVRWTPRRKADVVAAVADGRLGLDEACLRYSISSEEFRSWQSAVGRSGTRGLRVTRRTDYRVY